MTLRTRRIILAVAVAFFIILAPSTLFYSLGYTFDFATKKPVLTGGLYVQASPKKASIYIGDEYLKQTPGLIKRLVPKDYTVRLDKDGYVSWQKKLRVESGRVTEARDILLVSSNPKTNIVLNSVDLDFDLNKYLGIDQISDEYYVQQPSYIVYKSADNGVTDVQISTQPLPLDKTYSFISRNDQRILALSNDQELYIFDPASRTFILIDDNVISAEFCQDNNRLMYYTNSEIWIYYLQDIDQKDKELITRLSQPINQVIFYGQTNEHLVFSVSGALKIIELDSRDERNTVDIGQFGTSQLGYKNGLIYILEQDMVKSVDIR